MPDERVQVCKNNENHCNSILIPGSRHEVFVETDAYRNLALDAVLTNLSGP